MHNMPRAQDEYPPRPSSTANPADLRAAPRHTMLIRAAKLIIAGAEYLCILRDASETGVKLRLFQALGSDPDMVLELPNEDRHEIEMVWQADGHMGLRFHKRIDVRRFIAMPASFPRRPLRLRVNVPGQIGVGEDKTSCTVVNLSQLGARIACDRTFAIDQRIWLKAAGMPTVQAKVRWRRDRDAGLSLENTFQLAELADIMHAYNSATHAAI